MRGDFTRLTFDPNRHYSSVRMQQGRVQLDADWNEQIDIGLHHNRNLAKDVIGTCGAPNHNPGFALIFDPTELKQLGFTEKEIRQKNDFIISKGSYYVDGILCENENHVMYSEQPDYPLLDPSLENIIEGYYLAYIKVWERHITSVEDPEIQESALGGVDTTTRTKVIWQVKLKGPFKPVQDWDELWIKALPWRVSSIAARAKSIVASGDPNKTSLNDSQKDLGNQLYRVEVHNAGKTGKATFKWSKDNGSSIWPICEIAGNVVTIRSQGKILSNFFKPGQWIEITDDFRELRGNPGIFSQVISVDRSNLILRPQKLDKAIKIKKIEKNKIVIEDPGKRLLPLFSPGSIAEIFKSKGEDSNKVAFPVMVESFTVEGENVALIVTHEKTDDINSGSIEESFPPEIDPKIVPYCQIGLEFKLRDNPKVCCWDSPIINTCKNEEGAYIEKIEKNTVIFKKPKESLLGRLTPGSLVELTDNYRESRGQIRILAVVESQKIDEHNVGLMLKPDSKDDHLDNFIEEAFPQIKGARIIPYDPEKRWIELEKGIKVSFGRGDNHYRTGDYWLIPSRSAKGDIEWPVDDNGAPKFQQRFGIKHHYCRLAVLKYSSSGWSLAQDYYQRFTPLTELESKPDVRLREAINAVLKGNMPYDHQSNLLTNKSYLEAFEDFSGRIWLFARYEKEIWFARYDAGFWDEKCLIHEASRNRNCTPVIVEDSKSGLWIFWCQNENIWFNKCDTKGWGEGIQLTDGNILKSNPKAFDSKGCIWLFWQQEKGIWHIRNQSEKWIKEDKPLIEGPIEENPEVMVDSQNKIWIFWREKDQLWCMCYIDGKWHDRKMLSKGETQHLTLIEGLYGDIWAFWLQAKDIWLARHSSGSWNEPRKLTSTTGEKEFSSVFKDSLGNIWVFWKKGVNIFCNNFSYDSGDCLGEADLTAGDERKVFLEVIEDKHGAIWFFWWQKDKIFYKIVNSMKWKEIYELMSAPETTSFYPFNRMNGDMWIVLEKLNSVNFWCKRHVNGDWLPEIRLTSDPLEKEYLCSFEDKNSNQWLFWRRTDPRYLDLVSRRYYDII